ncbi:hypothetical protein COU24_01600, partial [Candidatus Kuenenbacteria bacterium CG10_big_fil_rev_8_21_14_0_10_39_14]
MLSKKLLKYLGESKVKHEVVAHKTVYTAYDAAQTMRLKLNEIAKSLLVKFNKPFINGEKPYALAIVGADKNIDLKKLKKVVSEAAVRLNKELRLKKPDKKKSILDIYNKVAKVIIPKEKELKSKLKVKPGAIAAFGAMYKLPVFIDKDFLKNKTAVFAGDSFIQSVKMLANDFYQLENAFAGKFSAPKKIKRTLASLSLRRSGK